MKIIKAYPPNFQEIAEHFPIKGRQGILYSWGHIIYNPSGMVIPAQLMAHEEVHGQRQRRRDDQTDGAMWTWWHDYLHDRPFRLCEELLAHRKEWSAFLLQSHTYAVNDRYLQSMSERLSSPLYGSMASLTEARDMILGDSP